MTNEDTPVVDSPAAETDVVDQVATESAATDAADSGSAASDTAVVEPDSAADTPVTEPDSANGESAQSDAAATQSDDSAPASATADAAPTEPTPAEAALAQAAPTETASADAHTGDSGPAQPLSAPAPAASFGEVAADGTVFLRLPDGSQREVGQWAAGDVNAALEFFTRKYQDLVTEIDLAAKRLADDRSTPDQAQATVDRVRKTILEPAFVGDMAALVARIGQLEVLVNVKKEAVAEAKANAKKEALAKREALTAEAESLAGSQSWKVTTERFRVMVDEWKEIPRFDRGQENEMWKRFSAARTTFDKARRTHYTELEAARDQAKEAKQKLVKQAKELSTSRDWAKTTTAYRDLLDKWKKAGRAGKADDTLWEEFRAAQDVFFSARNEIYAERDGEEKKALEIKEQLLTQAESLLPIENLRAAKAALRDIQEKWEKAGKIPRNDVRRIESRLKKVEDAVRNAEQSKWKNANTELKGRASDTVLRFRESVAKLQKQLDTAVASGNASAIAKAQSSLDGAKALLEAAERTSQKL